MIERPQKIYRGRFWFYLWKVMGFLFALWIFLCGSILPFAIGIDSFVGVISSHRPPIWVGGICTIAGCFCFWLVANWVLAFPEIGTSQTYLWFRHFGIWQKLRWIDVGTIDLGDLGGEEGIYIFSEQLPVYQRFSTFDPGTRGKIVRSPSNSRKGRALFISPSLENYQELVEAVPKLRWQATQRRRQEKRRHQR